MLQLHILPPWSNKIISKAEPPTFILFLQTALGCLLVLGKAQQSWCSAVLDEKKMPITWGSAESLGWQQPPHTHRCTSQRSTSSSCSFPVGRELSFSTPVTLTFSFAKTHFPSKGSCDRDKLLSQQGSRWAVSSILHRIPCP